MYVEDVYECMSELGNFIAKYSSVFMGKYCVSGKYLSVWCVSESNKYILRSWASIGHELVCRSNIQVCVQALHFYTADGALGVQHLHNNTFRLLSNNWSEQPDLTMLPRAGLGVFGALG